MRIDRPIIGAALIAIGSRAPAQITPTCARSAAERPGADTKIISNGRVVNDSEEFVARTGWGFLAQGSGQVFGITAYRCAECEMKRKPGQPPQDSFFAEPVVVSVTGRTPVQAGDVIEAVNDRPITSSAGAEQFSYPPLGANRLTLRRGHNRLVLHFDVATCSPHSDTTWRDALSFSKAPDSLPPFRPPLKRHDSPIRVRGRRDSPRQPVFVIDGVRIEPGAVPPSTRYGFAISCDRGCARVTNPDGTTFFRYGAPPAISAIRDTSVAVSSGLTIGDVIVKVDGLSILTDEASIRLMQAERTQTLRLTVLRDGKEVTVSLQTAK
jgi:PDZ domain-containing protein